jgi:hypothetical protein
MSTQAFRNMVARGELIGAAVLVLIREAVASLAEQRAYL